MRYPLDRMQIRRLCGDTFQEFHNAYGDHLRKDTQHNVWHCHQGWDLEAKIGTPIYAVSDGHIVDIGHHLVYGEFMTLAFIDVQGRVAKGKTFYAFYAHLSSCFPPRLISGSKHGIQVREGTKIGLTGNSGRDAQKLRPAEHHLHFEIRTVKEFNLGLANHKNPALFLGVTPYSGPIMNLPLRSA